MPTYLDHYFDVRPRRPGWSWSAYERDKITPLGMGRTDTKGEAEDAARTCIARSQAEERDRLIAASSGGLRAGKGA